MNPRWLCDESDIEARRSFLRWIQLLIWIFSGKNNKNQNEESAMKEPWNLHESDILPKMRLKSDQKSNRQLKPTFWIISSMNFGRLYPGQAWMWKRHETTMKVTWVWHDFDFLRLKESGMNPRWTCHESDMYCRFHLGLADSWHFHGIFLNDKMS